MSTKRIYRKRRLRLYLDVDEGKLSDDFKDEDSSHPRVYFRAPTWGDLHEAQDHGENADEAGQWLIALCMTGVGGDFGLCLHESTRALEYNDDLDDRLSSIKTIAAPDMMLLAGFVGDLASLSSAELGESSAAAA
jgi:hypothetical protein